MAMDRVEVAALTRSHPTQNLRRPVNRRGSRLKT